MMKTKILLSIIFGIVACFILAIIFFDFFKFEPGDITQQVEDLENHPIYKNYVFSDEKSVIELGDQPLWTPTSLLSTIMGRDEILREELDKLGYELRVIPFLKGNDVNYFLKKGKLEAGIGGDMPTIRALAEGDMKAISLMQEGPVYIISKNIGEVKNLKNKKIAYALGSSAHFYLLNTLQKNGVDVDSVDLVSMDVTEMGKALDDGKIDAFSVWEPVASSVLKIYPHFTVTHRGRSLAFLYIQESLIRENREVARQLVAAEIRALAWLRKGDDNILLAAKLANERISEIASIDFLVSPEDQAKFAYEDLLGRIVREFPRIEKSWLEDEGRLKSEFDIIKNIGFISSTKSWEDVKADFDLELLEEIIRNPVKYRISEINNFYFLK